MKELRFGVFVGLVVGNLATQYFIFGRNLFDSFGIAFLVGFLYLGLMSAISYFRD